MSTEDILLELKKTYLASFPAHLEEMEQNILAMETGKQYKENFESLYRKAHSLKGSGGTYGYAIVTSICHQMEDFISDKLLDPDNNAPQNFDTIFKYIDTLKETHGLLVDGIEDFQGIENQLKHLKGDILQHEINGILISQSNNMYSQICTQVFKEANAHYSVIENGIDALQRLRYEHFDFIITARENTDLNGPALIAALKMNEHKGAKGAKRAKLKTILITSNPYTPECECESINPDFVILKNKSFDVNLSNAIKEIKKSH